MQQPPPLGYGEDYVGTNLYSYVKSKVSESVPRSLSPVSRKALAIKKNSNRFGGTNSSNSSPQRPKLTIPVDENVPVMFPVEEVGFYKITSLVDAVQFIENLVLVAQELTSLVDNKIPVALFNGALNCGVIKHSKDTPIRSSLKPSAGSGGYIPAALCRRESLLAQYSERCFPTYLPPVGPFYMSPEQIEKQMAIIYPDGYVPYQEPDKKKKGRGLRKSTKPPTSAVASNQTGSTSHDMKPSRPASGAPSKAGSGVATTRRVR